MSEIPDKPWFNWYTWRLDNWDTKWGAYDGYTIRGRTSLAFIFNTAWSVSEPIIKRLKVLGYDFEVLFANESLGSHCGKYEYDHYTGELNLWYEHEHCKNPVAFAKRIWDRY